MDEVYFAPNTKVREARTPQCTAENTEIEARIPVTVRSPPVECPHHMESDIFLFSRASYSASPHQRDFFLFKKFSCI